MKTHSQRWLLNNSKKDFIYLIAPAFFIIFLSRIFPQDNYIHIFFILFIFHVVDSGHVYLTIFRTYANPEERKSSKMYWLTPLIVFMSFFILLTTHIPYVWHFIVYATLYHNVRQFYGVTRWYQKKISNYTPWPGRFLYTLCILSVVIYHFRSNVFTGTYAKNDIFHFPNEQLLNIGLIVYTIIFLIWLAYEAFHFYKKTNSMGRFLSLFTPVVAYGSGFIFGNNLLQTLGPIVIAHGVGYGALIAFSVQKTHPKKYLNFNRTMTLIFGVAIIFGIIESYVEEFLNPLFKELTLSTFDHRIFSLVAAIYLTPLFCHYIFDGFIWKSKHREAHLIYS